MSTSNLPAETIQVPQLASGLLVWRRQLMVIFRIEFGKAMFSRRAFSCYALISMPIILMLAVAFDESRDGSNAFATIESARRIFGYIFSALIIATVLFLGNAAIFTTLFRGEMLDRSIHYYLLTPVRREVLVIGKYLAGLGAAFVLFGLCTLICFLLLYVPFGVEQFITDLSNGIVTQQLGLYLGIVVLGSMGYGAVFMATGLLFKNPLIPIIVVAGWEMLHFLLPPALKIFSIIYYIQGLLPIPMDQGPLAVIAAPPPLWISIAGMFGLSAFTVAISVLVLKRLEIRYTDE
ncbi:MAG: hypothetical protein COB20_05890 [SAR86 cluster bacterium]|uniref:ABC transporter permease n=1 Tax=SAR86 cluster bacterium TaxID=2030880 RepID=A0A2A4X9I3_9GAMM|nr:MAG: hypothetical protein COB20_05890 [SAR86 cluster bacterium]